MCTVTAVLLAQDAGRSFTGAPVLRVICNRDEKRTRTEAIPPVCRRFADRTAILPIDPLSRGTWVGVNDAGLVLCLLNASAPPIPKLGAALRSRGDIIPSLLHCESVAEVANRIDCIDPQQFPPFRLLAVSRDQRAVMTADRSQIRVQPTRSMNDPCMLTSSSLGDELVDIPRRELFRELLRSSQDLAGAQHRFHTHRWPDRPHLSVHMSRPDARTVSRTIVEVAGGYVRMTYHALLDIQPSRNQALPDASPVAVPQTVELCPAGAPA